MRAIEERSPHKGVYEDREHEEWGSPDLKEYVLGMCPSFSHWVLALLSGGGGWRRSGKGTWMGYSLGCDFN